MRRQREALFIIALIVGITYLPASWMGGPSWSMIAWKGAGVGLLACWAALHARNADGWLITVVLAFGALGDVLIDAIGLVAGAVAFLAGHLVAIWLYWRHRRGRVSPVAIGLLVATPLIAWLLPGDRSAAVGIAFYATGLGAMAASAWMSRFSHATVGIGVALFVVSDLLIFARLGPLAGSAVPDLLVWPTYFAGQALIAWGVVTTLGKGERP